MLIITLYFIDTQEYPEDELFKVPKCLMDQIEKFRIDREN